MKKYSKYLIYALIDIRPVKKAYIGKSCQGLQRPQEHFWPTVLKKDRSVKGCWVVSLVRKNLSPRIEILEELDSEVGLGEREKFYIKKFKSEGFDLVNGTEGGSGGRMNEEIRQKQSLSAKKRWENLEERQKASVKQKLNWEDPEYRKHGCEVQRIASKKKWQSKEFREKRAIGQQKSWENPLRRKNHSDRMKKYWALKRAEKLL